jgi:hypothetical protein
MLEGSVTMSSSLVRKSPWMDTFSPKIFCSWVFCAGSL